MRKAIIAVLSVILVFAAAIPCIHASATEIDGYIKNDERVNPQGAFSGGTASNYSNIYVFHSEYDNYVYCGIDADGKNIDDVEEEKRGATVRIEGKVFDDASVESETIKCDYVESRLKQTVSTGDYVAEYAFYESRSKKEYDFHFEILIDFKNPDWNQDNVIITIKLFDEEHDPTDGNEIIIKGKSSTSPEDYGTTDSSGSKTTKASKTTTEKSTKTTTQKLTGGSRVPTTRRGVTTSAATTTKKPTEPQTTAAKTTSAKVRTTKAKTTRTRTTKAQSSRETASYAAGTGETTVVYMLDAEALSELINTTTAETQADRSAFGIKTIPRSTLLKGVTAAAALILFGIIGAWAVKSRSDDDEPPKDEKEDSGEKADNNEKED